MQIAQEHAAQEQEHAPVHEDPLEIDGQAERKEHPDPVAHPGEGRQEREHHHRADELDRQRPEVGVIRGVRPADGVAPEMGLADGVGGEGLGEDVVPELAPEAVEARPGPRRDGHARQALVREPPEVDHHGGGEADRGGRQEEARVAPEDGRRHGRACLLEPPLPGQRQEAVRYGVARHDEEDADRGQPRDDEPQDGQLVQPPLPGWAWCPRRLDVP